MKQGVRNFVVGMALVSMVLVSIVPGAGAALRGPVVGFGDSVAAGYGLSLAAEWPGSFGGKPYLTSRFAHGASCRSTRRAYPCRLAAALGANAQSRNYAIQGADTNEVLAEICGGFHVCGKDGSGQDVNGAPVPKMSGAARASVKAVTLTIGGNDFAFDQCIKAELQATPDSCIAGTLNSLQLSAAWQAKVQALKTNLPLVIKALGQAFPNATVYVTTYYQFVPGQVAPGRQACAMYGLPALEALYNNIHGLALNDAIGAGVAYVATLPVWMIRFQNRLARVSSFLQGQLNAAIREGVRVAVAYPLDASVAAPTPVALVSLDRAFNGHDVCSGRPWVYNFQIQYAVNGLPSVSSTAACPFPMPKVGQPPASVEINQSMTYSGSWGPANLSFSASFSTNCIPHPNAAGQRGIAAAISTAANGPVYCPPPSGQHEGVSGIRAQGVSCGFARRFVTGSRLCSIQTPGGASRCTDRGWACRVGRGVRLGDGIGGIPALCTRGRRFMSWHAGY